MLLIPSIRSYYEGVTIPDNGRLLYDVTDGQLLKNNSLIKTESDVVHIMIFQDAFEICNPLGSSKKKFKIVAKFRNLGGMHFWID